MSGQLYLNNGQPPNRTNVCVSGYQRGKDNFALSNFDDNNGKGYHFIDPKLGNIKFPTAEHYLHFQKIKPDEKANYLKIWQQEKSPQAILAGIRNPSSPYYIKDAHHAYMAWSNTKNAYEFNKAWDVDKIDVQMQINATKYQQSPSFQQSIHQSVELGKLFADGKGPASIIEDTSSLKSGKQPEEEWGTGPGGEGKNILGNSQTAFAMMVQANQINASPPMLMTYKTPQIKDLYAKAETQYQSGIQKVLMDVRNKSGKNQGLNQPDTSDLGSHLEQKITIGQGHIKAKSFSANQVTPNSQPQVSPSSNQRSTNQKLFQAQPRPQYYTSKGGSQRLVIQNDKIVGYEYRKDQNSSWKRSRDLSRFANLKSAFRQAQQLSQQPRPQYYTSKVGNQRLVIEKNNIAGYEYRKDQNSPWKSSNNPSHFTGLVDAFKSKQLKQLKQYYAFATDANNTGRNHLFKATPEKTQAFKAFKGDYLKTKILAQFKSKLENCRDLEAFKETVDAIKASKEFQILATGQGLATRILGLQTSSVEAFNKIVDDLKSDLSSSSPQLKV